MNVIVTTAPKPLRDTADQLLRASLSCSPESRALVRAVAKAIIDESEEIEAVVREHQEHEASWGKDDDEIEEQALRAIEEYEATGAVTPTRRHTRLRTLHFLSPPEMIEKAKAAQAAVFADEDQGQLARAVVRGYLQMAGENQRRAETNRAAFLQPNTGFDCRYMDLGRYMDLD